MANVASGPSSAPEGHPSGLETPPGWKPGWNPARRECGIITMRSAECGMNTKSRSVREYEGTLSNAK
jgi:hypothetical protein